jgi:RNA polymerase sigma-70 factor, ECF subfamily
MNRKIVGRAIVQRAAEGDHDAYKYMYDAYKDKVMNLAYYMLGNEYEARDAAQEIFIKLYTSLDQFRFECEFSTWLYRLSVNTCLDYIRKEKRRRTVSTDRLETDMTIPITNDSVDSDVMRRQISEDIEDAIQSLSPKLRCVMILRHIDGLSYSAISQILNCSVGTVSSRLYRGYKMLGKLLMHLKAEI